MAIYETSGSVRLAEPGGDLVPVTPNDSSDLPNGTCRALRCIGTGTVSGITAAGELRSTELYQQGEILPCGWQRINSTGTTASVEAIY